MAAPLKSVPPIRREPVFGDAPDDGLREHAIGHYIRQVRGLSDLEIGQILAYQRANGLRFGEAAIALKLATSDGPIARRMNRLGGRMGLPVRRSFQTKNAADAMTTSASGDATYHDHPSGPRRETSTSSVPAPT